MAGGYEKPRARVLVIDDEPVLCRTIRRMLAEEHDVTTASSSLEALATICGGERFDVILCDLMMPELTGADLQAELARQVPDQAGNFVLMSGGAITNESNAVFERAAARLEKPFARATLLQTIETVLKRRLAG